MTRSSDRCPRSRFAPLVPFSCWALLAGFSTFAWGQIPTPQLTTIFPPGGKVGSTVEVRVGGADLDDARQLLFSHPGIQAVPKMAPATEFEKSKPVPGVFTVQVAANVPPGNYDARVFGRFGVSNPRAFVAGVLNEANDPGGNAQPAAATPLAIDTTLNGTVDGNQRDFYKLALAAGQRIIVDCKAQRIDSRLDGTLVLFDPAGKEIQRSRGYVRRDPLLDFTPPTAGEYVVALYDFTYRGGGDYFYRLTAQTAPYIDFVFPPSGLPGSNDQYTVFGRNLPGGQPADGLTLAGAPLQKLVVNIPLPSTEDARLGVEVNGLVPSSSSFLDAFSYRLGNADPAPIYFAKGSVVRETEPNNLPSQSNVVSAPCEIVGQFGDPGDIDSFTFAAKKGDVFNLEVFAHRLGLDADPFMLVQKVKRNEKGEEVVQEIAQVDDPGDRAGRIGSEFDTSTDDPEYKLTADEDANYRVMVRDQFGDGRTDPRYVYRLAVHRGEADFRLIAYAAPVVSPVAANVVALGGSVVRKGSNTLIEVRVDRRYGFNGEVEISAQGLPPGVTSSSLLLNGTSSSGALVVTAAETASAWTGSIRIVGRATIRGSDSIRYARSGVAVWNSANRTTEFVPYRLTSELALAVVDRELLPAVAQVAEDKVWETSRGGTLQIPIKVTRRGDFKDDLTLAPADVPNELKPANLVIKGAEAEGKLQFVATNANAKPGVYTFYLRADAKFKYRRNPDAVAVAEQEQKEIDAAVAATTAQNKQAVDAKTAAMTAAQAMVNAVKQAEQAKAAAEAEVKPLAEKVAQAEAALKTAKEAAAKDAANQGLVAAATAAEKAKAVADAAKLAADQKVAATQKALADAQAAAKAAEEAKANMDKAAVAADAKLKATQQAKAAIDKRLADAKTANNPKDVQFAVISTPIKVRIVESCLKASAGNPLPLKAGEKIELPVKLERLYGFDDQVELTLELPGGLKGVTATKVTLAKGQAEGKFEITAAKDATAGDHLVTVRAKGSFNKIENQATQVVKLSVLAAP